MKVNQYEDKKYQILEQLFHAQGETVSGVQLSDTAGISRVAVWKHIKALKASGLPIEAHPKGYTLNRPEDLLYPFCFKETWRPRIFYFPQVTTTMDTAKQLARDGAPHLSCCIAGHQTHGRGRLNRQWISDQGGLWFTLILKPELPPPFAYIYNFAAATSLSRTINGLFDLNTRVKWPNDLLLNDKKVCGLLSEMETQADMVKYIGIGMGLNVNNMPNQKELKATSIKAQLGHFVSRRQILEAFLEDLSKIIRQPDIPDIMTHWRKQTSTIGSQVQVETLDHTHQGRAIGVDDSGSLIIETDDGKTKTILYGDCFHKRKKRGKEPTQ